MDTYSLRYWVFRWEIPTWQKSIFGCLYCRLATDYMMNLEGHDISKSKGEVKEEDNEAVREGALQNGKAAFEFTNPEYN